MGNRRRDQESGFEALRALDNNYQEDAFENLEQMRATMSKYFDKTHLLEPDYKVGDLVMLDARNIKIKRPT